MGSPSAESPGLQLFWLFVLAIPVACVAWTVTHEEVFREPREYCIQRSQAGQKAWERKFFYLFTCEYCFSHYVALFFILLTGYRLLLDNWRGYLLSFFAVVWVANIYLSLFSRLRVDITSERVEVKHKEKVVEKLQTEIEGEKRRSDEAT